MLNVRSLVLLSALSAPAAAQVVDFTVYPSFQGSGSPNSPGSDDAVHDSTDSGAALVVMTLDTNGVAPDFSSWAAFIGNISITHSSGAPVASDILTPVELITDEAGNPAGTLPFIGEDNTWRGRRPASWGSHLGLPPAGNSVGGSFRFPDQGGFEVSESAGAVLITSLAGGPINAGQMPAALGNSQHNPSRRLDVFAFEIDPSIVGTYTFTIELHDLAYYVAGNNVSNSGLQNLTEIRTGSLTVLPAPSTRALLAPLLVARRRRL